MTNQVFPTLSGLSYDVVRTPVWQTEVVEALSGKRSTMSRMSYPLTHFELTFSILRDDIATSDVKALVGLFNLCQGRYDSFLFTDPDFSSATLSQFGVGDGTTTTFPLTALYQNTGGPGYTELIQNLNGAPQIYVNGTLQTITTNYTISGSGIVTFQAGHIPAAAASINWTGSFYYRCAFDDDKLDMVKFMNKWWMVKKLPFTSVKL